jgi:hypothetical protein
MKRRRKRDQTIEKPPNGFWGSFLEALDRPQPTGPFPELTDHVIERLIRPVLEESLCEHRTVPREVWRQTIPRGYVKLLLVKPLPVFAQLFNYRWVYFRGREYWLTAKQATVVQSLDQARRGGGPPVNGKLLLTKIGVTSANAHLRDVFQRTGLIGREKLIVHAGGGDYFLNV